MIYQTNGRELSLVEQKKLQWAREKEEMSRLNEMFSATTTTRQIERTSIRTYYSNMDLTTKIRSENSSRQNNYYAQADVSDGSMTNGGDHGYCYHQYDDLHHGRVRSPSLPPIGRNKNRAKQPPPPRAQMTTDEDTSGYLSDSRNSPETWKSLSERSRPRFRLPSETRSKQSPNFSTNNTGIENMPLNNSSTQFDRNQLKQLQHDNFADKKRFFDLNNQQFVNAYNKANNTRMRESSPKKLIACGGGMGQGRKLSPDEMDDNEHETDFSIPKTPSSTSSDGSRDYSVLSSYPDVGLRKDKEERAKWGDRGVTVGHFYDPITKDDNVKTGPGWLEKGFQDSEDESVRSYSFIRGQNAPIDANTLAERASRRLKAIEFQNAIKEQLEERERIKRMEEEKKRMEERVQEDRIRRQMQIEQERVEMEQRKQQEKIEAERKKQEVMRLAIEKAKEEAVIEKAKKKKDKISHSDVEEEMTARIEPNSVQRNQDAHLGSLDEKEKTNEESNSIPSGENENAPAAEVEKSIDDGDKILIGSPIRMRKKTIGKTKKTTDSDETDTEDSKKEVTKESDIDGIALVLQSLPPLVPILSNDLLSLNQNLNTMNNIQLAVMLAHQMQHLNPLAMNMPVHPVSEYLSRTPPSTAQSYSSVGISQYSINPGIQQYSAANRVEKPPDGVPPVEVSELQSESEAGASEVKTVVREFCKICDRKQKPKKNEPALESDAIPYDRTFTRDSSGKKDAITLTLDTESPPLPSSPCIKINEVFPSPPQSPSLMNVSTVDASTQTEGKSESDCCCQHHQHHHHHVYVKEIATSRSPNHNKTTRDDIKTIALDILTSQNKDVDSDATVSSTIIHSKGHSDSKQEPKEPIRLEDRPKWGVNRPNTQYVKASERDPFYLRNKRKKYKKRVSDDVDNNNCSSIEIMVSRSTSPSLIASSSTTESPQKSKRNGSSRNICTEILPIKTDVNGRVYLNFREASMVMSEDEVRQNLKNRYAKMERIMNRRRTSDDIITDLGSKKANDGSGRRKLDSTKRTYTDVDLKTA